VLADHGLQPATTFDQLKAQCAVLSKAGITTMHEAGSSGWPVAVEPLLYASTIARPGYVADVLAHKAKFNDPDSPLLAGFQDWADRKAAGCFNSDMTTATFEAGAKAVYEAKAAYQMIHSNIAAVYLDEAGGDKGKLDEKVGFVGSARRSRRQLSTRALSAPTWFRRPAIAPKRQRRLTSFASSPAPATPIIFRPRGRSLL
jgi:hypothetical protein